MPNNSTPRVIMKNLENLLCRAEYIIIPSLLPSHITNKITSNNFIRKLMRQFNFYFSRLSSALTITVTASALVAKPCGRTVLSGYPLIIPFFTAVTMELLAQSDILSLSAKLSFPASGAGSVALIIIVAICSRVIGSSGPNVLSS